MSNIVKITEALNKTSKGQLRYDSNWLSNGDMETILKECSSPPTIGFKSPPKKVFPPFQDESFSNETTNIEESTFSVKESKNNRNSSMEGTINPDRCPSFDGVISPEVVESELALRNCEGEWSNKAKTSLEQRKRVFESHSKMLHQKAEADVMQLYWQKEKEIQRSLQKLDEENRAREEQMRERKKKMEEDHMKHKMKLDAKMREAETERKQQEDAARRRQIEAQERLNEMHRLHLEMIKMRDIINTSISTCKYQQFLHDAVKKYQEVFNHILGYVDKLTQEAKTTSNATEQHVKTVNELVSKARNAHDYIKKSTDDANKKGEEEDAKKAATQKAAAEAAAAAQAAKAAATTATTAPATNTTSTLGASVPSSSTDEVLCVIQTTFQAYEKLQNKLKVAQKQIEPLVNDAQLKKYKFDLQKAVNTPVNAIAPTSGAHLRDKLQKICGLLSGQTVEVGGNKKVAAKDHPAGLTFCKNLFAAKIVKQGDEQVSSRHESAFAIAAVAVGVWCVFPDIGDYLLPHFHAKCPYIVPYYVPRTPGQSAEDHYKSLGYNYSDGTVEKQDKFLKRMSGMIRLYAAVIVAPPPRGNHPHGIENAWRWLTEIMNLDPRPDITATITYDFLEVTGNALFKHYGKQFIKLIQIFRSQFLPKVVKVTPEGSGGPTRRLENFLDNIIKKGALDPPAGLLAPNFWYT